MIKILDEYLKISCPKMGVKVGSNYVAGKFYIDDLSLMMVSIEDLQKAFRIIENFCASFGFKVNINKTEICVFGTRGVNTPNVRSII